MSGLDKTWLVFHDHHDKIMPKLYLCSVSQEDICLRFGHCWSVVAGIISFCLLSVWGSEYTNHVLVSSVLVRAWFGICIYFVPWKDKDLSHSEALLSLWNSLALSTDYSLHHCHKTPDRINLKEERFNSVDRFREFGVSGSYRIQHQDSGDMWLIEAACITQWTECRGHSSRASHWVKCSIQVDLPKLQSLVNNVPDDQPCNTGDFDTGAQCMPNHNNPTTD